MVEIGPAMPADVDMIVSLLNEMDEFYGDPESETVDERARQVKQFLFDGAAEVKALVARDGGSVVGVASYSMLWPAVRTTRSLYLKELYVLKAWRGKGVGRQLMDEIDRVARELGCSRVEFTTDTNNHDAQAFYTSLGFEPNPGKIFYRREMQADSSPVGSAPQRPEDHITSWPTRSRRR
jgi:GNAT superfamily N-acetyltransferase